MISNKLWWNMCSTRASLVTQDGKEPSCNVGDRGSIPGSGRAPGQGNCYPLQYSYLKNSMDRGAWRATVHGSQRVWHNWATNTYGQSFENNILNIFYTINTYSFKIDERLEWKRYNTYKHFLNDEYLLLPSTRQWFLRL